MPFYLRKSVKAGPFRFNLSKSGLGLSVGVKGLRFGTGPRGHYVHAGRGGLYYRASLEGGRRAQSPPLREAVTPGPRVPISRAERDVDMVPVSSGDVLQMTDERFGGLLDELNAKQATMSLAAVLGWSGAAIGTFATLAGGAGGLVLLLVLVTVGGLLGGWLDQSRRSGIVFYDLEPDAAAAYGALTEAFDAMAGCAGKWHVDAGGEVRDLHTWKRNAGASHLLDRRPTSFGYSLPRVLKANVTPPSVQVGKETLYFLPDVVLVVESTKIGAVAYDQLSVQWQDSSFIEDGAVPGDAKVIDHRWAHPNKKGGPDRRFRDNRQLPVCLYESVYLTSTNGLNELLQLSRTGTAQRLASATKSLARSVGATRDQLALPKL